MNEMDMVNEPVAVKVAGVTLKVKRLSTIKRRAIIEAVITEQAVAGIMQRAELAYSKPEQSDKKYAFIDKAMLAIPSGKEMADLVSNHVPSVAYSRMVAESAGIQVDQATDLLDEATGAEVHVLLRVMAGKKK